MVTAVLNGELDDVEMRTDKNFCFDVPVAVPDVPHEVLDPKSTWSDPDAYDKKVRELTSSFHENFSQFAGHVPSEIAFSGPDLRCR